MQADCESFYMLIDAQIAGGHRRGMFGDRRHAQVELWRRVKARGADRGRQPMAGADCDGLKSGERESVKRAVLCRDGCGEAGQQRRWRGVERETARAGGRRGGAEELEAVESRVGLAELNSSFVTTCTAGT